MLIVKGGVGLVRDEDEAAVCDSLVSSILLASFGAGAQQGIERQPASEREPQILSAVASGIGKIKRVTTTAVQFSSPSALGYPYSIITVIARRNIGRLSKGRHSPQSFELEHA